MRRSRTATGWLVAAALATWACGRGGTPAGEAGPPLGDLGTGDSEGASSEPRLIAADEFPRLAAPWTGDLDGMVERRVIRVLVPYSAMFYYVDQGEQRGIAYEGGKLLEGELNRRLGRKHVRVHVVFMPVARDRLIDAVAEGYGDLATGNLTITPERLERVAFSEPTMLGVQEVVVSGPGVEAPASVAGLAGRRVFVRPSSSYAESLRSLSAAFEDQGKDPIRILDADERLEDEDILEMVQAGLAPMTVVDEHKAGFWSQVFPELRVHETLAVRTGGAIGWAFRRDSPQVAELVNAVVRKNRQGTLMGNIILKRYLEDVRWVRNATSDAEMERFRSMADVFHEYGGRYDLDWLLVMAQGYQESGLDQSKRSRAGAIGVMQLLPTTARDPNVGIPDIQKLENNVHAGTKYLRFLVDRYFSDPGIDEANRLLLAFAAYNAGPARVARLRQQAQAIGLDPNVWFDNVEVVAAREIGRETVQYVGNIFKYYVAYKLVDAQSRERREAVQRATG